MVKWRGDIPPHLVTCVMTKSVKATVTIHQLMWFLQETGGVPKGQYDDVKIASDDNGDMVVTFTITEAVNPDA